jgi:hypothetical protein
METNKPLGPHSLPPDLIPIGIDKCNKKIMIATTEIRIYSESKINLLRYTKRLEINPLVKRCGINPALRSLVLPIIMSKLILIPNKFESPS